MLGCQLVIVHTPNENSQTTIPSFRSLFMSSAVKAIKVLLKKADGVIGMSVSILTKATIWMEKKRGWMRKNDCSFRKETGDESDPKFKVSPPTLLYEVHSSDT